jgi:peptidoglycan-associated lipoprotein
MRLILCAVALAWILAGCAPGVRLDNVPVEDRGATQVNPDGAAGGAGTGALSGVVAVEAAHGDGGAAAATAGAKVVYFDYDSFVIKPEFQSVIESNARFLLADRKRKLAIEGHTDERGGREYNLALGQKRAEAVRQALSLLGVEEAQLEAVSFGKEKPADLGNDEAALAKNRRAELRIR